MFRNIIQYMYNDIRRIDLIISRPIICLHFLLRVLKFTRLITHSF